VSIQIIINAESALAAHEEIAALAGLLQARNAAYAASGPQEPYIPEGDGIPAAAATTKRTRRTKAQIEADEKAAQTPALSISTTPEDRQDPEMPEEGADVAFPAEEEKQADFFDEAEAPADEDDLIDGYAVTDEGLVAAMKAYVAKFDMAAAQTNAKTLFGGYTKRSEVAAAGEAALATAIRNFSNAVNTGKAA
jgi:hypothetical protein